MMGCAWCCCFILCGRVNGASPVRFVLSLFYLCAYQMNPVCVVRVVTSAGMCQERTSAPYFLSPSLTHMLCIN